MNLYSHFVAGAVITDAFPFQRELYMESWIVENKDVLKFGKEFDDDIEILSWETTVSDARNINGKTGDGRIDIIARYGTDVIAVIELKLEEAGDEAESQLSDYMKKKDEILDKLRKITEIADDFKDKKKADFYWIGILCAERIAPSVIKKIEDNATVDELRAIAIKRFINRKNGQVYVIADCYQTEQKSTRNIQKIIFNGTDSKKYGKGRGVFEAVRRYIEKKNPTFDDLKKAFPDRTQGNANLGVCKRLDEISDSKRYFQEEFFLEDGTGIRVCNQWGIGNINNFIACANELNINMQLV